MAIWQINRVWKRLGEGISGQPNEFETLDLSGIQAVCMRGAAGLGKTFEIQRLAAAESASGRRVQIARLAELVHDGGGMGAALDRLVQDRPVETTLFLDALDESMIDNKFAARSLSQWIRTKIKPNEIRLRIACRSAVWPPCVSEAIESSLGQHVLLDVQLQPIDSGLIAKIASDEGLDGDAFIEAVEQAKAIPFAQHPLTLHMLIKLFRQQSALPRNRSDLFAGAVAMLANERTERIEVGTSGSLAPHQLETLAEMLAVLSVLSGRDTVDLSDNPSAESIGWDDLRKATAITPSPTKETLRSLSMTGLFEGELNSRFRFAHRQLAEFLAGRAIARMPLHQVRPLLASNRGWKGGIASQLRETAAFAANANSDVAAWLSRTDPAVIGLSDVAEPSVRRDTALELLARFDRHEFTDVQVKALSTEIAGLKYPNAARDLAPYLKRRGNDQEDVLECAIEMCESWEVTELSNELADLVLDTAAPNQARVAAGYALRKMGTPEATQRLKAIVTGNGPDPDRQLRGVALRCLWPDHLTDGELLDAMSESSRGSFWGAYEHFLIEVGKSGFCASRDRVKGLEWAGRNFVERQGVEPRTRIAKSIAQGAIDDLDNPAVLAALTRLLLDMATTYRGSPLSPIRDDYGTQEESGEKRNPFVGKDAARRMLLVSLAATAPPTMHLAWLVQDSPGLLEADDFHWLIDRALDPLVCETPRKHFAELARSCFSETRADMVERWLSVKDAEPIKSAMNFPDRCVLKSRDAKNAREYWLRLNRPKAAPTLCDPPPAARVAEALNACDTDPSHFPRVAIELTLKPDSEYYGTERFVQQMPGWVIANTATRTRIVNAARRFLQTDTSAIHWALSAPFNQVHFAGMAAISVADWDPAVNTANWLRSQDADWWCRWAWYILRELHPNYSEEPDEQKRAILALLLERAPAEVIRLIDQMVTPPATDSACLFQSLLYLFLGLETPSLEAMLAERMTAEIVSSDRLVDVASFLLKTNPERHEDACLAVFRVHSKLVTSDEDPIIGLGSCLLLYGTLSSWDAVMDELSQSAVLATHVLGSYAYGEHLRRYKEQDDEQQRLDTARLGRLLRMLFDRFPPEADPVYEGAHSVTRNSSARRLRSQLLSHLPNIGTKEAVEILKRLESELGAKYPWLRRSRSIAEYELHQSAWDPIPIATLIEVFNRPADSRLIRSPQDALDGICEAIRLYEQSLRSGYPQAIEDLWNTADPEHPTPKSEERSSDKLCDAIRAYFAKYAITTAREVQIRRRNVPTANGGEPGSKVDVLVSCPSMASATGGSINIPVEVKRSENPEAKTGLKEQLVDRYMNEANADGGVFVVMWFDAPGMPQHRPKWASMDAARLELHAQAQAACAGSQINVVPLVVDCTLR